jgi:hypothetical protein
MADKTKLTVVVQLIDGTEYHWIGDVEILTCDGVLTIYNYSLRDADPSNSGLVFASDRGAWKYARIVPNE